MNDTNSFSMTPLGDQVIPSDKPKLIELLKVKRPVPAYRHAAPSAPWPWMDFNRDDTTVKPLPQDGPLSLRENWRAYPQNLYGNWTPDQVARSRMLETCSNSGACSIYTVDVLDGGCFDKNATHHTSTVTVTADTAEVLWEKIRQPRPGNLRLRALFVENLSIDVLQILGTKYDIEPFFFSSSANWIPSRYQEDVKRGQGDHITITLPFICTWRDPAQPSNDNLPYSEDDQQIDPQRPFSLSTINNFLLQDLLAIHLVRTTTSSTIISYHPTSNKTSAKLLRSLVHRTGDSVYWSKIFQQTEDPTFVFLAILWYALYAWDQVFEALYKHINQLEFEVLADNNNIPLTRELHKTQAYLLHYQQLLEHFKKSVEFVRDTPNPALETIDEEMLERSKKLMDKETRNLVTEIERLENQRQMQSARLKNAMDLAFATVNIEDSRAMANLTVASLRDSAAVKQISYLTMIFLPASLLSNVFSMNVQEINPQGNGHLNTYIAVTLILSTLTAWLVIAMQTYSSFWPPGSSVWRRLAWPAYYLPARAKTMIEELAAVGRWHSRNRAHLTTERHAHVPL